MDDSRDTDLIWQPNNDVKNIYKNIYKLVRDHIF